METFQTEKRWRNKGVKFPKMNTSKKEEEIQSIDLKVVVLIIELSTSNCIK